MIAAERMPQGCLTSIASCELRTGGSQAPALSVMSGASVDPGCKADAGSRSHASSPAHLSAVVLKQVAASGAAQVSSGAVSFKRTRGRGLR
jgi:hypothetical protein